MISAVLRVLCAFNDREYVNAAVYFVIILTRFNENQYHKLL